MGREYQIECDEQAVRSFDEFLRRQPYFRSYDSGYRCYKLAVPGEAGEVGYATIGPNGIYFCDNLSSPEWSGRILQDLIDEALSHSGRIVLYEP